MADKTNLGDGIYATFDGDRILLTAIQKTGDHEVEHLIPISCQAFISLILFGEKFWTEDMKPDA